MRDGHAQVEAQVTAADALPRCTVTTAVTTAATPAVTTEMTSDTVESLSQALDAVPLDARLHTRMLAAMRAANDEAGSAPHELALAAFDLLGDARHDQLALVLYNIATVYALKGQRKAAIRWYRHTLGVHPELAIAHQNLAVALDLEELCDEARAHRERAYQLQRVFVDAAFDSEQHRVLILGVGKGTGNVPLEALLPAATTTRIRYAIDCADEAEDAQLPPYDVVFNGIGDADVAAPLAARLTRFAARCERPMLNPPCVIERTHRHETAALLETAENVVVPHCMRIIAQSGLSLPALMRPLAAHGGERVELHTSGASLWAALGEICLPCYLTSFHDFCSADGYYRKYRVIFVDREPYPYHLAISSHGIVHNFSADVENNAWKLREEQQFLANPFTVTRQ